jgi:hypothetical protein
VNRFEYGGTFVFPVSPDEMWQTLERFDRFESWWTWLRHFDAEGAGLADGNVLHGVVVPPVPYRLRVDVRLTSCARPRLVEATVDGDLRGWARIRLSDAEEGARVTAVWSLEMGTAPLRVAAQVAYPLMRWGHDRVVDMAVAGFRRNALPVTASR